MKEKPRYRLLPGEEHLASPYWPIVNEYLHSQPPLRAFYAAYERVIGGNAKPGDKFFLLRELVTCFGTDNASIIYQLGRLDENASWLWGISLFERTPPILKKLGPQLFSDAKKEREAKRERRHWVIYNRVLAMLEGGSTLPEAYRAIAGTKPGAQNLGEASIEKIWKAKSKVVRETGERLVPQFGGGALVMQPGRQPKRGRRAKVAKTKV